MIREHRRGASGQQWGEGRIGFSKGRGSSRQYRAVSRANVIEVQAQYGSKNQKIQERKRTRISLSVPSLAQWQTQGRLEDAQ